MLAVVLYHFDFPGLNGGFVGVDVFFVISGFLIGGLLWSELGATGRIALGAFYMRRVRRLAPAYFAMATASTIAAAFILLPFEFREFGKSLIAATAWLSNVQFWREAGYFDIGSESKVLLHTWSLSVEEQFYVFLPLALIALAFIRKITIPVLVILWAASLYACVALTPSEPAATFFLFPFRAWELLTGVLLAIGMRRGGALPDWGVWVGLALIGASIFTIQSNGFPGWQAILPVAGTALVLAGSGRPGRANRLLSHPGPVFIGLISYSLYLWHWPVLTLSRYWRDGYSGPLESAFWLGIATLLAILGWALVERPLRRAKRIENKAFLTGSLGVGAALLLVGGVIFIRDGLPARFAPDTRLHIAASQDFLQDWSRCTTPAEGPFAGIETCAIGPDGPPEVIVWGDSHLRALMNGLGLAALESGTPGIIIWHAGCPPLFGLAKAESAATPAQDAACLAANVQLQTAFTQVPTAKRILLVGRWAYYATGTGSGGDVGNTIALTPAPGSPLVADTQAGLYAAALASTVETLNDSFDSVAILRQVPEIPAYDSRSIARALAHGRLTPTEASANFTVQPETLAARVMDAEAPLYALASEARITLIDPWPRLCPERCSVMLDGRPVYFDNNHLTNAGAIALRDLFLPFLSGAAPE